MGVALNAHTGGFCKIIRWNDAIACANILSIACANKEKSHMCSLINEILDRLNTLAY